MSLRRGSGSLRGKVRRASARAAELLEKPSEQVWTSQDHNCCTSPLGDIGMELFVKIVGLRTGEALLFAPGAVIGFQEQNKSPMVSTSVSLCSVPAVAEGLGTGLGAQRDGVAASCRPTRLTCGFLKIRVRKRILRNGGRTIMAV